MKARGELHMHSDGTDLWCVCRKLAEGKQLKPHRTVVDSIIAEHTLRSAGAQGLTLIAAKRKSATAVIGLRSTAGGSVSYGVVWEEERWRFALISRMRRFLGRSWYFFGLTPFCKTRPRMLALMGPFPG